MSSSPNPLIRNEINIKLEELKNTKRVLDDKAKQLFEVLIRHFTTCDNIATYLLEREATRGTREIISPKTRTQGNRSCCV